jgi:methyltransferase-like protein
MGVLIVQGVAQFRLDPVLPEPSSAQLTLDEPARRMAELSREQGEPSTFNLWHETVPLTPLDAKLLPLLDGSRDRDALVEALLTSVRTDQAHADDDGGRVLDDDELRAAVAQYVDETPQRLAELKLLRIG